MSDINLSDYANKSALQLTPLLRTKTQEELNAIQAAVDAIPESSEERSKYVNLIKKLGQLITLPSASTTSSSAAVSSGSAAASYNSTSSSSSSAAAETMYGIFKPAFIETIESHKNAKGIVGEGGSAGGSIVRKITLDGVDYYVKIINPKDSAVIMNIEREIVVSMELTARIPEYVTKCMGGYVRLNKAYILYEYLHGITLDKVSNQITKDPSKGAKGAAYDKDVIFSSLKKCVEEMHKIGFVHRDLKPDNVFCCFDGTATGSRFTRCILIDFGETQRIGDTPRPIAGNGNPLFHNKEIDAAQASGVTPEVDLFALAKIATNPTDRVSSDGSLGIDKKSLKGDSMITRYLDMPSDTFEGGRRKHKRSSKTRKMKRKSKHTRKSRRRN
jgi:hypothetical protein